MLGEVLLPKLYQQLPSCLVQITPRQKIGTTQPCPAEGLFQAPAPNMRMVPRQQHRGYVLFAIAQRAREMRTVQQSVGE